MNICLDCGAVFEDGKVKRWTEPHGEPMIGCPLCGGSFESAERCEKCGKYYEKGTLYDGLCVSCLTDSIAYDTALQFLLDTDEYFDIFMFETWYGSDVPQFVSEKLRSMMITQFKRERAEESLLGKHDFLDALRKFILEDDGDDGKALYAMWIRGRKNAAEIVSDFKEFSDDRNKV